MSRWRYIAIMVLTVLCVACKISFGGEGDDDEPRLPEVSTETPSGNSTTVKVTAHSIEQNAIVDSDSVTLLSITYSADVVIDKIESITLNERVVTDASTNGNTLNIPLSLQPATAYTLIVKRDALSAGENSNVVAFTLSFFTRAVVNLNMVDTSPCNRKATAETKQLYSRLFSEYGKRTFMGAIEESVYSTRFTDLIHSATGHFPAIVCYDLQELHTADFSNIPTLKAHHEAGGIIVCRWNWLVPESENATPDSYSSNNNFNIINVLKDTSWEYRFIESDLEKATQILQIFKTEGIPVIFSPMDAAQDHWWGKCGAPYFRELWKLIYDRLTVKYGLDNILWAWSVKAEGTTSDTLKEWYPGEKYVDIISTPLYADGTSPQTDLFLHINETFKSSKMIAISSCGNIPDIDTCHNAGDTWLYICAMNSDTLNNEYPFNTPDYWQRLLTSPYTITLSTP